ncbi:hypothetical protein BX666DRAFT_1957805 [Dichotomocladium elegans]|nr:hypothetical protein BX666DRAFT_1957805 [Dichotomocladium elegans]
MSTYIHIHTCMRSTGALCISSSIFFSLGGCPKVPIFHGGLVIKLTFNAIWCTIFGSLSLSLSFLPFLRT